MIVVLNGSFGVGKSTVARLLRDGMSRGAVYNPEWVGSVLMRLPLVRLEGSGTDDFQDIALWRRSVIAGVRCFRSVTRGPVIVPMAFSRYDYLDEVVTGLKRVDPRVRVFCLRAESETIRKRLEIRGGRAGALAWSTLKAEACAAAHRDERFGEPIDTEKVTAREVAAQILTRLGPF